MISGEDSGGSSGGGGRTTSDPTPGTSTGTSTSCASLGSTPYAPSVGQTTVTTAGSSESIAESIVDRIFAMNDSVPERKARLKRERDARRNLSARLGEATAPINISVSRSAPGGVSFGTSLTIASDGTHNAPGEGSIREQEAARSRDLFFSGDVTVFAGQLIDGIVSDNTGAVPLEGEFRGMALATVGALVGGSHLNRIAENDYDPIMAAQIVDAPRQPDRTTTTRVEDRERTYQRRRQQRDPHQPVAPAMVDRRTSRGTLLQTASVLANKMLGRDNPTNSIMGFFSAAPRNPIFGTAVARALLPRLATGQFARDLGSARTGEGLLATVTLWANRDTPLLTQEGRGGEEELASRRDIRLRLARYSGIPVDQALGEVEEEDIAASRVAAAVTALITNKLLASRIVAARVCFHCLALHLTNENDHIVPEEGPIMDDAGRVLTFEEIRRILLKENGGLEGAIEMSARAHSREMHSTNGNIHFATSRGESRVSVAIRLRDGFQRGDRYYRVGEAREETNRQACERELPAMSMSRAVGGSRQSTSCPPTLHCFLGRLGQDFEGVVDTGTPASPRDVPGMVRPPAPPVAQVLPQTSAQPEGIPTTSTVGVQQPIQQSQPSQPGKKSSKVGRVWRKLKNISLPAARAHGDRPPAIRDCASMLSTLSEAYSAGRPSCGDSDFGGHREGFPDMGPLLCERSYWVGVGGHGKYNIGSLVAGTKTLEFTTAEQDPTSRDGRINPTFPQRVWSYVNGGATVQGAVARGVNTLTIDIRALALKTKLLDSLRSPGGCFPSGVNWAVPLRADIPSEIFSRDIIDAWEFRYTAVSMDFLDVNLRAGNEGMIPVGAEVWSLSDPSTAVIVLDESRSITSPLWALQIIMALPHPLISKGEWFAINDHNNPNIMIPTAFLRNEGLVSINNRVNKIILVNSAPRTAENVSGIRVEFAHTTRQGAPGALAVIHDARDLIIRSMDVLLRQTSALTDLFNTWYLSRSGGIPFSWSEVEAYYNMLIFRYPRQEEVAVRAGDDRILSGLPNAFKTDAFGTATLPRVREDADQNFESYDHSNAVTALDHVVTDKDNADDNPILTLGCWPNAAELATGLQYATIDNPTYHGNAGRRGKSLPIDGVERSIFLRRMVEEWKVANGNSDEVAVPGDSPHIGSHWYEAIMGDRSGDDPDCLETLVYGIFNLQRNEGALSWQVNQTEAVNSTLTGIRTSKPMWLSEEGSGRATYGILGVDGFEIQSGGDWWTNGRVVLTKEPTDAPDVERIAGRADCLMFGPGDVVYATYPDLRRAEDYSFRVDTSVFQTLAIARGWGGVVPAARTAVGLPIPLGWGVKILHKDWIIPVFRTLTFSPRLSGLIQSTLIVPGMAFCTPVGALPFPGTGAQRLYKNTGLGGVVGRSGGRNFSAGKHSSSEAFESENFRMPASPSVPPEKAPPLGGPGEPAAQKLGSTVEEAERNLDHRAPADTA